MIRGVFELGQTAVQAVMVPRRSITAVSADASLDSVAETAWREHVMGLPVYGDSRDGI